MSAATPGTQEDLVDLAPSGRLESGLTSRTWPVIFYGALVLMPANIYLMLVAGQSLIGPISFIALILWVEVVRLSRRPLTTAEAFIVYSVSAVAAGQLIFYIYAIHPAYFRVSEVANSDMFSFIRDGKKVTFAQAAPRWWAPPADVVRLRSFFHRAWLLPIGVGMAAWFFHLLADLSMGVLGYHLFVKVEKLPFPFAHPPAEACKALTAGSPEAKKVFTIAGLIGAVWGLLIYLPLTLGKRIADYPIPWADFNRKLHSILRGASLGIATDILAFVGGFIVPFRVIVSMVIGAFAIQFVGNAWAAGGLGEFLGLNPHHWPLLSGIRDPSLMPLAGPIPQEAYHFQRFVTGMGIKEMLPNQIFVWMPVIIAGMVCAGLLPILSQPKDLYRTFSGLARTKQVARQERTIPLGWLLGTFLFSVIGATALFTVLVRVVSNHSFPWYYVAPFALVWSLLFSLIDIRAIGTTGFRVEPPYVREGMIIAMKPRQIDIWFAPWPVALGASGWVQNFKTAELTGCTPRSLIVAKLIAYPVGMLASLLFMSIFWSIAPIPSAQYPYTTTILPVWANQFCIWISASLSFSHASQLSPATQSIIGQLFNFQWMLITAAIFFTVFRQGKPVKRWHVPLLVVIAPLLLWVPVPVGLRVLAATVVLAMMWVAPKPAWIGAEMSFAEGLAFAGLLAAPTSWLGYHWAAAGAAFLVVFVLGKIAKGRAQLSLIGLAVGMVMPIPFAISLLAGGLAAKWIRHRTGAEWFGRNRNIIVGGLAVGEGVVIGLLAAVAALRSSLIALPY